LKKRQNNSIARKVWEQHHGPITQRDTEGFIYEVHHKDFDANNNSINNLELIPIRVHLERHASIGDWASVALIAKRLNLGPTYMSDIQRGKKRPRNWWSEKG
jgi:hypothetical protein